MAAGEGFEPSHTESESAVLPLHNPAIFLPPGGLTPQATGFIIPNFAPMSTPFFKFSVFFPGAGPGGQVTLDKRQTGGYNCDNHHPLGCVEQDKGDDGKKDSFSPLREPAAGASRCAGLLWITGPGAVRPNRSRAGRLASLPAAALLEASERRLGNRRRNQGGTASYTPLTSLGQGCFFLSRPDLTGGSRP